MSDSSRWQLITVALAALTALIVLLNVDSAIAAAVTFLVALAVYAGMFLTDPGAES